MIVAIDPGPTQSTFVVLAGTEIRFSWMGSNTDALDMLPLWIPATSPRPIAAIEWYESFAMRVGSEVFDTVYWIGRFDQEFGPLLRIGRKELKIHLCGTSAANDADVRAALIARYGGKKTAIGNKKEPGPLYGIKGHLWSALAVAVTANDKENT